jgi:hypothetical protein
MCGSAKRSRRWTEKGLQPGVIREAAKTIPLQCADRLRGGKESDLIKDATSVADEINADTSSRLRLDHGPILLEHLHDLLGAIAHQVSPAKAGDVVAGRAME